MVVVGVILLLAVVMFGILFLRLHTLPERMAHKSQKIQFEIVAILGLIALFTHMHIFWIAGLLLAVIDFPDFGSSLGRIAESTEKMAGKRAERRRGGIAATDFGGWHTNRALKLEHEEGRRRPGVRGTQKGAEPCLNFFSAPC